MLTVSSVYLTCSNNGPTRFFPASRCSLRDGAGAEEEGACADAMAPQLPPAQPRPNLGEISPSPDRRRSPRPPLIRSSPGKGARDLATGSGAGVGIGGFGMRAAQLPNPARPPNVWAFVASLVAIFSWCVAVESDRFEFVHPCLLLLRRGPSLVVVSTVVCLVSVGCS